MRNIFLCFRLDQVVILLASAMIQISTCACTYAIVQYNNYNVMNALTCVTLTVYMLLIKHNAPSL